MKNLKSLYFFLSIALSIVLTLLISTVIIKADSFLKTDVDELLMAENNNYYFFVGANRNSGDYVDIGAYHTTAGWKNLILNQDGGNVGIGTTAPGSYKLNVSGNTYIGGTLGVTGATTLSGGVNFPGSGIWNSSGNVGIGTTSPGVKLEIAGVGSGSNFITFKDTSGNSVGSISNNSSRLKIAGSISKDLELGANTQTRLIISGTDGGVSINGLRAIDGLMVTYSSSPLDLTYSGYEITSLKANCSNREVAMIKQCWATKTSGVSYIVWSGLCSCSSYRPDFWANNRLNNTVYYQWRPLGNGLWKN